MPLPLLVPLAYVAIDRSCLNLRHRKRIFLFFFYRRCSAEKASSMCSVVIVYVECKGRVTVAEGVLALRASDTGCLGMVAL